MKNETAGLACAALGRRDHLPVFERQLIWDLEHKGAVKSRPRRDRRQQQLLAVVHHPAIVNRIKRDLFQAECRLLMSNELFDYLLCINTPLVQAARILPLNERERLS